MGTFPLELYETIYKIFSTSSIDNTTFSLFLTPVEGPYPTGLPYSQFHPTQRSSKVFYIVLNCFRNHHNEFEIDRKSCLNELSELSTNESTLIK